MPTKKKTDAVHWISNESANKAFVTVDKQLRLYFNTIARELFKSDGVILGYDFANKRIIIGDSNVVRPANVKPHPFDKRRHYVSARPFLREVRVAAEDLPIQFEYVGKDYAEYPQGAHAFELVGDVKAGGDGRLQIRE